MKVLWGLMLVLPVFVHGATAFVAVPDTDSGVLITDATERMAKQVQITQRGAKFFWASNNNAPLTRHFEGDKIIFVADSGEGLIVILNQSNLPEDQRQGDRRPFLYCEHIRAELSIMSLCGGSQEVAVSHR